MKIAVIGPDPPTLSDYMAELRTENAALKAEVASLRNNQQPQLEMPCESDFMVWCGIQHYNLAEAASIYRYIARHIKRVR